VHKAQVDSQAKKVLKENAENQVSDVMEELVTPDPLVSLFWLFLFFDHFLLFGLSFGLKFTSNGFFAFFKA
jgi:hypothetical protein